jgi:hypothetical protein
MFLRPSVHGLKRAGRIFTMTMIKAPDVSRKSNRKCLIYSEKSWAADFHWMAAFFVVFHCHTANENIWMNAEKCGLAGLQYSSSISRSVSTK